MNSNRSTKTVLFNMPNAIVACLPCIIFYLTEFI